MQDAEVGDEAPHEAGNSLAMRGVGDPPRTQPASPWAIVERAHKARVGEPRRGLRRAARKTLLLSAGKDYAG